MEPIDIQTIITWIRNNNPDLGESLNLAYYSLTPHLLNDLAEAMKQNTTLKEVNLRGKELDCNAIIPFLNAIKTHPSLHTLNLQDNNLGLKAAVKIAELLEENSVLKTINLSNNLLKDAGITALSVAIHSTSLTHLDVSNNQINDLGISIFINALSKNTSLKTLILSDNYIGDKGLTHITSFLILTTTLHTLNLTSNLIGDLGAHSIARGLLHNHSLKNIYLNNNHIGDQGAEYLAPAIETGVLQEMDLKNNRIGDIGAIAISAALSKNTSISSFDLSYNHYVKKGKDALLQVSKVNPNIANLMVDDRMYQSFINDNIFCNKLRAFKLMHELHQHYTEHGQWIPVPHVLGQNLQAHKAILTSLIQAHSTEEKGEVINAAIHYFESPPFHDQEISKRYQRRSHAVKQGHRTSFSDMIMVTSSERGL